MTNDQARMTNGGACVLRHSSFAIDSSFWFRHSSFTNQHSDRMHMSVASPTASVDNARRIDELGRIIIAYSEVTEKLQQSHDQLMETVRSLRSELGEKNRLLERKNRLAALGEMAAGLAHEI